MANFPFTVTENSITIFIDGAVHNVPKTHAGFPALAAHLKESNHNADLILQLLDKRAAMARLTAGKVKVVGDTVFYGGAPLHNTLARKIVLMMDEGFDATPLVKFMENVMQNPDERSREQTFDFVDRWNAPLTEDGCFVAFKGVNGDYSSTRSNPDGSTVWNRPGDTVTKPREACDSNPENTCSHGLHVCASHYLDSFWSSCRVIAVKVNPKDVVSVPIDYQFSKMRVCEYYVLGDIEDDRHRDRVENASIVSASKDYRVTESQPKTNNGFILPQGWVADEYDGYPCVGDYVVRPGSETIGEVIELVELNPTDIEHPDYNECVDYGPDEFFEDDVFNYIKVSVDFGDDGYFIYVAREDEPMDELQVVIHEESFEDEEKSEEATDEEPLTFFHEATNQTFTASAVKEIVEEIGQRGFQREYGVPRTTVQEWLKAIQ